MGFLYRVKQSLQRFMMGRNGLDALGMAILVVYLVLGMITRFLPGVAGLVFYLLCQVLFLWELFRFLSTNLAKRQRENQKFLAFWQKLRTDHSRQRYNTVKDPQKVIRTCKQCKAKIRLPKVKGKHSVTCPKCGATFTVKI